VNHFGPQLFARTGFAGNEHSTLDFGRPLDMARNATNTRVAPQHPITLRHTTERFLRRVVRWIQIIVSHMLHEVPSSGKLIAPGMFE
jgi:hypothetical protein